MTYKEKIKNLHLSNNFEPKDFRLCYVSDAKAYFTTKPLSEQWGDDWDDAPYEHNAGEPYYYDDCEIIKIFYEADLEEPYGGKFNSVFSVEMINNGEIPWLRSPSYSEKRIKIMAGTTLEDFVDLIESINGHVFVPIIWFKDLERK